MYMVNTKPTQWYFGAPPPQYCFVCTIKILCFYRILCVFVSICVSCAVCLFCLLFVLHYSGLSAVFYLIFVYSSTTTIIILDACLFSNEREKVYGFGSLGRWQGPEKSWGKRSHNKNILYEKPLSSVRIKNRNI